MHCQPAALREVRPECICEGARRSAPLGPPAVGNPLSPKKRILRQGSPQSARARHRFSNKVKPAFLGKVPVRSHLLRADKTLFEPMAAVRERRVQPQIRRQKNPVGPGWSRPRLATRTFQKIKSWDSGSRALMAPSPAQPIPAPPSPAQPGPAEPTRARFRHKTKFVMPHKEIHMHFEKVAEPNPRFRLLGASSLQDSHSK